MGPQPILLRQGDYPRSPSAARACAIGLADVGAAAIACLVVGFTQGLAKEPGLTNSRLNEILASIARGNRSSSTATSRRSSREYAWHPSPSSELASSVAPGP